MPDGLLGILKLCLLALIYLFFVAVLYSVTRQLRTTEPSSDLTLITARPVPPENKGRRTRRRERGQFVVIEGPRKGEHFAIGDEMTIGRAAGCHITIDDTFVSQLHARVFHRDGAVMVEDLGSTNGTAVNDRRITTAVALAKGDRVRVGDTVLELR